MSASAPAIVRHPGPPGPIRETFLRHCPCATCDAERAREQTEWLALIDALLAAGIIAAAPTTRSVTYV
jgi:hypothetical protein